MHRTWKTYLCLAALAGCFAAAAQDPPSSAGQTTVEARISPLHDMYVRPAVYTLTVETAGQREPVFPEITAALIVPITPEEPPEPKAEGAQGPESRIEVSASEPVVTALKDGRVRIQREYIIDPIKPGEYFVPALEIGFGDGGRVSTAPFVFNARVLSDEEHANLGRLASVAPPAAFAPKRPSQWLLQGMLIGLGILAGLALAGLLATWRLRVARAPAPPLPPWETARQRLKALATRQLPEQGRFEVYYIDLSSILRYYLEDRFSLHAPEQTTQELLETVASGSTLTAPQQEQIAKFMRHCDRVKFARYKPASAEMAESFDLVSHFVEETVPAEEPLAEEAAA